LEKAKSLGLLKQLRHSTIDGHLGTGGAVH